MCDSLYTPLQSGVLFWVLSLVPINIFRYIGLGAAAVSGAIFAAHYHHPSTRMARLNNMLSATTEILARAKSHCLRDHLDLANDERRLLRAKLCASKIQSRLLEARDAPWKLYFQTIRAIWLSLNKCERQVRDIRTSTLLTIEAEHQRKLAEHIKESREIVNAVVHSPRHNKWATHSAGAFEPNPETYIMKARYPFFLVRALKGDGNSPVYQVWLQGPHRECGEYLAAKQSQEKLESLLVLLDPNPERTDEAKRFQKHRSVLPAPSQSCDCVIGVLRRAKAVPTVGEKVVPVQVELSPFELKIETSGFVAQSQDLGFTIISYSPLGRANCYGRYNSRADFEPADVRLSMPPFSEENFAANLNLVHHFEATSTQVALAWILTKSHRPQCEPGRRVYTGGRLARLLPLWACGPKEIPGSPKTNVLSSNFVWVAHKMQFSTPDHIELPRTYYTSHAWANNAKVAEYPVSDTGLHTHPGDQDPERCQS
ncbi:hypothetical protein DFH09DRAFT_1101333 [Mycena vulgaris]|nr:hypothetical protein DFH09DRAFT_1101333 [Mycena vulgaris]